MFTTYSQSLSAQYSAVDNGTTSVSSNSSMNTSVSGQSGSELNVKQLQQLASLSNGLSNGLLGLSDYMSQHSVGNFSGNPKPPLTNEEHGLMLLASIAYRREELKEIEEAVNQRKVELQQISQQLQNAERKQLSSDLPMQVNSVLNEANSDLQQQILKFKQVEAHHLREINSLNEKNRQLEIANSEIQQSFMRIRAKNDHYKELDACYLRLENRHRELEADHKKQEQCISKQQTTITSVSNTNNELASLNLEGQKRINELELLLAQSQNQNSQLQSKSQSLHEQDQERISMLGSQIKERESVNAYLRRGRDRAQQQLGHLSSQPQHVSTNSSFAACSTTYAPSVFSMSLISSNGSQSGLTRQKFGSKPNQNNNARNAFRMFPEQNSRMSNITTPSAPANTNSTANAVYNVDTVCNIDSSFANDDQTTKY